MFQQPDSYVVNVERSLALIAFPFLSPTPVCISVQYAQIMNSLKCQLIWCQPQSTWKSYRKSNWIDALWFTGMGIATVWSYKSHNSTYAVFHHLYGTEWHKVLLNGKWYQNTSLKLVNITLTVSPNPKSQCQEPLSGADGWQNEINIKFITAFR